MPTYSKFTIYLQPYVSKYLLKNSELFMQVRKNKGGIPKGVVYFDRFNVLGKMINTFLGTEKCKLQASESKNAKTVIWFSNSFYNKLDGRNKMLYISKECSDAINSLVKDYMLFQLEMMRETNKANGISKKDTIERFLRFYNIEHKEMTYEAAKKALDRMKKTAYLPNLQ